MIGRACGRLWLISHQVDIIHPLWHLSTRVHLLLIDRFDLLHLLLSGGQRRWRNSLLLLCGFWLGYFGHLSFLVVISL